MEFAKGLLLSARQTPIEKETFNATNGDPWGPHGQVLASLSRASFDSAEREMILSVLWKRLLEKPDAWRSVYKALAVIEHLVAHGSGERGARSGLCSRCSCKALRRGSGPPAAK